MPPHPEATLGDTTWFVHDRFGMFIHWGLYALPARHEWVKSREQFTDAQYQPYFDHFDPDLFDPSLWAKAARAAGMKYVVITAKHHDGFCLWDSQFTDYKAPNTPAQRDVLRAIVEAFRQEGLRIGFYYSLIDWHHPDFTLDIFHPLRDVPNAAQLNEQRDMGRYAAYLRDQVGELLTQYGQIDILWCDFSYPERPYNGLPGKGHQAWQSESLYQEIRRLAPRIILNNRLDLQGIAPDFYTPEQYQPQTWVQVNGKPVVWEACHTFSGSWGYHRDETTWKSPEQLIHLLINTVAAGGNLLMNVGPTGRGTFDTRAVKALHIYADWMHLHSRSIYGCTQSDFAAPSGTRYTQNNQRLYVHLLHYPFRHLQLPGLAGKVTYAQFLHDASEIHFKEAHAGRSWDEDVLPEDALLLSLPIAKPDVITPVVELFLK
jgi:alpha-L-fucosidase